MPAKGVAPRRGREAAMGGASQSGGGPYEGETSNDMARGHNLRHAPLVATPVDSYWSLKHRAIVE